VDNFQFSITSEGDQEFRRALALAFDLKSFSKVTHYVITPKHGLVFFWHDPGKLPDGATALPMPYPMGQEGLVNFAEGWLKSADYGKQPNHDGSNGKGWTIYNEAWGHVMDSFYAVIAIKPAWAMYGK
jgi:hypothetical protein